MVLSTLASVCVSALGEHRKVSSSLGWTYIFLAINLVPRGQHLDFLHRDGISFA
jgi:hypothetical protein